MSDDREAVLRSVTDDLRGHVRSLEDRLENIAEDSYATRNELDEELSHCNWMIRRIKSTPVGEKLDLRQRIVNYGYDYEAAAADRNSGLEYVSEFARAKGVYEAPIDRIQPQIEKLRSVGIEVETGVVAVGLPHYESDLDRDESEQEISPQEKVLRAETENPREQRDELLEQRDRARQIMCDLADHIQLWRSRGGACRYPEELIRQVDLARNIGGYQFPTRQDQGMER